MDILQTKNFLDNAYKRHNQTAFVPDDPISIPHRFSNKEDIEISGFFAAIFAWGQRKTIINKTNDVLQRMDNTPFQFVTQHQETDLKKRSLEFDEDYTCIRTYCCIGVY